MEWIETTAGSVTEAKDLALDKLGVHDSDALFEILEEPKKGFLGRTRGVARVRARIAPKAPPPKNDRSRRRNGKSGSNKKGRNGGDSAKGSSKKAAQSAAQSSAQGAAQGKAQGSSSEDDGSAKGQGRGRNRNRSNNKSPESSDNGAGQSETNDRHQKVSKPTNRRTENTPKEEIPVEQVIERVEDFLGGLIRSFGLEGEVTSEIDGDYLTANVGVKDGVLIGPKGRTLDAIQELARVSAQRLGPTPVRIKVDIGGYRQARRDALVKFASQAADKAISEGVEVVLEPMSSSDRKVLHDALGEIDGVGSRSAGNEPRRRVVVVPDSMSDESEATPSDHSEQE